VTPRRTTAGLVAGGLGAYWPQFAAELPGLEFVQVRV
jgi:L-arabinose isomerase